MTVFQVKLEERFSVQCPHENCTQDIDILEFLEANGKCPNCKHELVIELRDSDICSKCDDEGDAEAYATDAARDRAKDEESELN